MSYFRELPNLEYQSFLSDRKSVDDYLLVKNIFRRVKLRDDLQNVFTLFNKYQIPDGSRPELVAEELYGSVQYDWIVLISAGITRIRDEWPLSDKEVYEAERALIKKQLDELAFALGYKGSLNLEERNKKRQLLTDLQVLDAEYNRKLKEDQKKANEDALAKQKEQSEKLKAQKEKEAQERIDLQRKINALNIANVDEVNLS